MPQEPPKVLNILVADDEPEIRELLGEYLSARGHQVRTAEDGQKALSMLDEFHADVLLTDVKMPVMEGVDLVRAVKERGGAIGIVVMTGFPTIDTATTAMKMGASDYLLKPFRLRDVHAALVSAAARSLVERRLDRLQQTCDFYEAAHAALSSEDVGALVPMLLDAALGEVQGAAASVWRRDPGGGFSLAASSGVHPALAGLVPGDVQSPRREPELLAIPITARTHRFAVIAVAGASVNAPERLKRLRQLGRALALAVERTSA